MHLIYALRGIQQRSGRTHISIGLMVPEAAFSRKAASGVSVLKRAIESQDLIS
jgi:hypothetical protein